MTGFAVPVHGRQGMRGGGRHRVASVLTGAALCVTAAWSLTWNIGVAAASGSSEPISQQEAASAVKAWLADTNEMWTQNNFSSLNKVTTGSAKAAYQSLISRFAAGNSSKLGKPFTLSGLSVAVPCQSGSTKTFVAYANTDVFTYGEKTQNNAMIFEKIGNAWKLADSLPKMGTWPKLCTDSGKSAQQLVLPVSKFPAKLAETLSRFSVATTPPSSAAAPFQASWFVGATSVSSTFLTAEKSLSSQHITVTQKFEPSSYPTFAWPLADGKGAWVVAALAQQDRLSDPAGNTTSTWPGGASIATPHPATVHSQQNTYSTTYSAIDPTTKAGGPVTIDGFKGLTEASTAS